MWLRMPLSSLVNVSGNRKRPGARNQLVSPGGELGERAARRPGFGERIKRTKDYFEKLLPPMWVPG